MVHNRYRERGGEESVYEAESRLLEAYGHHVIRYEQDSRETEDVSAVRLAARSVWSVGDHREIGDIVRREQVRVAHFHNTFPLISPAAHHAARGAGAAVVQTLHNFRLLCPGGLFLRDGAPCEKCLGRAVPWPAIVHRCYRDSAAASTVVTGMLTAHRVMRTWQTQVDAFIALSRFARERFVAGGLPADRMHVSGGGMELPAGMQATSTGIVPGAAAAAGAYFLYVGRLEQEKGVGVLLDAWQRLSQDVELRIIGDGGLRERVTAAAAADTRIRWLGATPRDQVLEQMRGAYALVFPSLCYENFPGVLAEAQAMALPVIASALGSGAEVVTDGKFGVLFDAGDAMALAAAVVSLRSDPEQRARLAVRARARYEETLTPDRVHGRLLNIYESALAHRHGSTEDT